MTNKDRLIVALDVDTEAKALELVRKLKNDVKIFKVGLELFSSAGTSIVGKIKKEGCEVFLDLKFHDIPNTVARAATAVTGLGAFMINVHALGGYEMMKKAVEAVRQEASRLKTERPKLIAVTVLTSTDENGLKRVGISDNIESEVMKLASLAKEAGLDGVVASAKEAGLIRAGLGKEFLIVTPGVRPSWAASGDQRRVAAPADAIKGGADYIVIGRPVTEAADPGEAAKRIAEEMER